MDKLQINVNNCRDADAFHPAGKRKKGYDLVVLLNSFESTIDDLFQLFFFDWLYTLVNCVLF